MADLSVTAASVAKGPGAVTGSGLSGEAITQGQPVYHDPVTDRLLVAQAAPAGAVAPARAVGIALTEATGTDQPVTYQSSGYIKGMGQAAGLVYVLSGTKGGLSPHTDVTTPASTERCTVMGVGVDATYLNIGIVYGGAVA